MGNEIIHLKSVSEIHQMLGITRPQHPMITLLDVSELDFTKVPAGVRITMDLYSIWLKDSNCAFQYGRHHFDFDNGVLVFTGPGQVISQEEDNADHTTDSGWVLVFHPDLIRQSLWRHRDLIPVRLCHCPFRVFATQLRCLCYQDSHI